MHNTLHNPKKIVIIEDYDILRQSLVDIINAEEDYEVVGEFENYETALKEIKQLDADILITDITLPGISGIEGIKRVKFINNKISIIVFSVHENSKIVFEALCNGAIGYITKNADKEKIVEALHTLVIGGAPMSTNIARMVVESMHNKILHELTIRENEVLSLLSKGRTYASIADELYVSVNTIKTHVKNIYEKLQIKNKDELIALNNK
jgi:DNA-binding NarL/FixJ family response regulator